jgi:hypothetical protein
MFSISLKLFDFSAKRKCLSISSDAFAGHFPREINVSSHHTQRVVKFKQVMPGHRLFNEDFWDGEQMVYVPEVAQKNVESLVVYHCR